MLGPGGSSAPGRAYERRVALLYVSLRVQELNGMGPPIKRDPTDVARTAKTQDCLSSSPWPWVSVKFLGSDGCLGSTALGRMKLA